jgi:hypothetical protein
MNLLSYMSRINLLFGNNGLIFNKLQFEMQRIFFNKLAIIEKKYVSKII